jgi:hypothetical protein
MDLKVATVRAKVQLMHTERQVKKVDQRGNLHFMTVQVTYRDRGAYIRLVVESLACVG